MSYNQTYGKINKSESKPVEKALPANQLLQLLEVEVGNFSSRLMNLLAPAKKIKNLARKLEVRGKRRAREAGDRSMSEYYSVTVSLERMADTMESSVNVAGDQAYRIEEMITELRRMDRGSWR